MNEGQALPEPVPVRPELAAVLSAAVALNLYRDSVSRAELELAVLVDVALAAGCDPAEVRSASTAFRLT